MISSIISKFIVNKETHGEEIADEIRRINSLIIHKYIQKNIDKSNYELGVIGEIERLANVDKFLYSGMMDQHGNYIPNKKVAERFFYIIEFFFSNNCDEVVSLKEYLSFFESIEKTEMIMKHDDNDSINHFISDRVDYLNIIEEVISQSKEKFVNFLKLISEVVRYYDDDLPTIEEWSVEVNNKENVFELPASLLIPVMVKEHSDSSRNLFLIRETLPNDRFLK